MAARAIETVEAAIDLGTAVAGQGGVGGEHGAGIGLVDHVEADPVQVQFRRTS